MNVPTYLGAPSPARAGHDEPPSPHMPTIAASVARLLSENPHVRVANESAGASVIGTTTHAVVAILAPLVDQFSAAGLAEVTLGLSRGLCSSGRMHRRNSMLVAGFAAEYLRGLARPRSPWVCIDTEMTTTGGVVDLVWENAGTGIVFVDEVKTTQVPRNTLDKGWVEQARRYAEAGKVHWEDRFAGVRLLPLGSMHIAARVAADGVLHPLAPSSVDPLAGVASW